MRKFMEERKVKLQQLLTHEKIKAFITYDTTSIYYMVGERFSMAAMAVTSHGITIFVDGRYYEIAKKNCNCDVVLYGKENISSFLKKTSNDNSDGSICFDETLTYEKYKFLQDIIDKNKHQLRPIKNPVNTIRMIKDANEISAMKRSADISFMGFLYIKNRLKEGITEEEVAWLYESFCRSKGASGMAFPPLVAFGNNSAYPHHHSNSSQLKDGDAVLIDVGVVVDGYCSDMTRTLFFGTSVSPHLKSMYNIVLQAYREAIALCYDGATIKQVDEAARNVFIKNDCEDKFTHSLGHGIGLLPHESPLITSKSNLDIILKKDMVITIEPGLYDVNIGGVRYENTIVITDKGSNSFYPE
jgi:Xaa-Pro aminopeptidase